jgi:hypothetical protein
MRIPGLIRQYERTCDDCGYRWHVPRAAARPRKRYRPSSGYSINAGIGNPAGGLGNIGGALRDRAALERVERDLASARAASGRDVGAAARAVEDLGHCAQCGSEEYSQRPLRS